MKKTVERNSLTARVIHWSHVVSTLMLFYTGLALYAKTLNILATILGGFDNIRYLHRISALVFIGVPVVMIIANWKGFIVFLKELLAPWSRDDWVWIKRFVPYLFDARIEMPEQGKLKSGQRFADWFIIAFSLVLVASGFVMWFPDYFSARVMRWMHPLHDISMMGLGMFLLCHIYLGLGIFKPYRGMWRLMFGDGKIELSKAKYHWANWVEEQTGNNKDV